MFGFSRNNAATDRSFLPEDYIERKAERRTNIFSLTLFAVVMVGVVGAFLVTNRQWNDIKRYQEAINVRYSEAAKDIEELKKLEEQKSELLEKAELTTALIERVPRSILLAELINRMPTDITLLELELKSTRATEAKSKDRDSKAKEEKAGAAKESVKKARTNKDAAPADDAKVGPPRYQTRLGLIGVTTAHGSVARYVAGLQQCPLLKNVELKFSEKTIIQDRDMYRFRIEAEIKNDADARRIEPLASPRNGAEDPTTNPSPKTRPALPRQGSQAIAPPEGGN